MKWPLIAGVLIASLLWFGAGVWSRARSGLPLDAAAVQELPTTLLFVVVAFLMVYWRSRRGR